MVEVCNCEDRDTYLDVLELGEPEAEFCVSCDLPVDRQVALRFTRLKMQMIAERLCR